MQTEGFSPLTTHKARQFSKSNDISVQCYSIDVSQSPDDLARCNALARKHHKNFLLLIVGLVERLIEAENKASLTRIDLPIIPR